MGIVTGNNQEILKIKKSLTFLEFEEMTCLELGAQEHVHDQDNMSGFMPCPYKAANLFEGWRSLVAQ